MIFPEVAVPVASEEWSRFRSRMTHPITLVACAILTLLATISGPFETIDLMPLPLRFAYWALAVFGTTLCVYVARALIERRVPQDRPFLFELAAIGLTVLLSTPLIISLKALFSAWRCLSPACVGQIAFYVAVCTGSVFVLRRVIPGFEPMIFFARNEDGGVQLVAPAPVPPEAIETPPRPRLYRRLPADVTGEVMHLTAQGHFVTVTTSDGAHSLRMRFGDAVDEMDAVEGYCTHRSHWVARSAVTGHTKVDGKPVLMLSNGMAVPVSRTYRPGLVAAGLIPESGS